MPDAKTDQAGDSHCGRGREQTLQIVLFIALTHKIKKLNLGGGGTHLYNPSTWEEETGGSLILR